MPLKRLKLDAEGRILEASPVAAGFLGADPETLKGRFCWDVVRGTDDFGRPVCARCPVLARLDRGAYEAEVRLRTRGRRIRCQGVAHEGGYQIVLDERRRPKLGEVLYSLAWATQRMAEEPLRFFQTLEVFLGKLRRAAGMEAAELFLADPERRYLILTAVDAENASAFLERPWFALGEGYPGIVALARSPLVTHRLDEDERYLRLKVKEAGYRTYLVYPLELPQGVIGVLNLASKNPEADDRPALELLEVVAPVLASGIYAALTSLGEKQLLEVARQVRAKGEVGVIEELLRSALAFSGAKAAVYKERSGRRVAVPSGLPPVCELAECPTWQGEPLAVRAGGKPCPLVEGGRPRYCLPVVVGGEVVAMETVFFSRVPKPATRAMAPLLWLQRLAWQMVAPPPPEGAGEAAHPWLEIRALGPLKVRVDGEPVPPGQLGTLSWRLFKLFLAHPERPLTQEEIAEALWPDEPAGATARRVPRVVHGLRQRIEPDPKAPRLVQAVDGGYLFRLEAPYVYDVERFEERVRTADGLEGEAARKAYLAALDLYRGDFLAEETFADWAEPERAYLRALAVRAGERAGELLLEAGEVKEAVVVYRRLTALDPGDPYLLDRLAEALKAAGQLAEAAEAEARAAALLAEEV